MAELYGTRKVVYGVGVSLANVEALKEDMIDGV
jgi:hypothetical protein